MHWDSAGVVGSTLLLFGLGYHGAAWQGAFGVGT